MPPPILVQNLKAAVINFRQRLRGGDPNAARLRRRQALSRKVWIGLPYIRYALTVTSITYSLDVPIKLNAIELPSSLSDTSGCLLYLPPSSGNERTSTRTRYNLDRYAKSLYYIPLRWNTALPPQVHTYWNWNDVHLADRILEDLEQLRDRNATSDE